jgi:hypothetical protein
MNKQFKTNNIIWTCYRVNKLSNSKNKLTEHFEKNELALPLPEVEKLESDAIPNPNVPKQFVFPAKIMKKIKVYKGDMFGTPLKSDTYVVGKNTFRFADLGDYDSSSSYTIGNIVSFKTDTGKIAQFVNLVVIPGAKLNNPITDNYAWTRFDYAV